MTLPGGLLEQVGRWEQLFPWHQEAAAWPPLAAVPAPAGTPVTQLQPRAAQAHGGRSCRLLHSAPAAVANTSHPECPGRPASRDLEHTPSHDRGHPGVPRQDLGGSGLLPPDMHGHTGTEPLPPGFRRHGGWQELTGGNQGCRAAVSPFHGAWGGAEGHEPCPRAVVSAMASAPGRSVRVLLARTSALTHLRQVQPESPLMSTGDGPRAQCSGTKTPTLPVTPRGVEKYILQSPRTTAC